TYLQRGEVMRWQLEQLLNTLTFVPRGRWRRILDTFRIRGGVPLLRFSFSFILSSAFRLGVSSGHFNAPTNSTGGTPCLDRLTTLNPKSSKNAIGTAVRASIM